MSYSIAIVLAIGLVFICCAFAYMCMSFTKAIANLSTDGKAIPVQKKIKTGTKATKEVDRLNRILDNIETYDGTSIGQKEID